MEKTGQHAQAASIACLTLILVMTLFLASCATVAPHRAHLNIEAEKQRIKTLAFLPPRVQVFQVHAGGVREKSEENSAQARKNLVKAIEAEMQAGSGLSFQRVSFEDLPEAERTRLTNLLDDTHALFEAVSISILLHTYPDPKSIFEEKVTDFDYLLGKEVNPLANEKGQALLFINGSDHVWTAGRWAQQATGAFLGMMVNTSGLATGVSIVPIPALGGGTSLSAALVDSESGDILWYKQIGSGAGLQNAESAAALVKELFKGFPLGEKKTTPEER